MRVHSGQTSYEWIDDWAKIPDTESARTGWAHHGVVVTESGEVITFHPGDRNVLVFDKEGDLLRSWDSGLIEAHQTTLVREGDSEYLWLADNGAKRLKRDAYERTRPEIAGQVIKTTLEGRTVLNLRRPDHPVYQTGIYSPTEVVSFV